MIEYIVEPKSPHTGIVHALRYRKDHVYNLVADVREGIAVPQIYWTQHVHTMVKPILT